MQEFSGTEDARPQSRRARGTVCVAIASLASLAMLLGVAGPSFASSHEGEEKWYDRIDFSGDFRARNETFVIDGVKDRNRLRYRLRAGAKTEINDHVDFGFRLATGPDVDSGNQTLGSGVDFDPDGIFVDRAYITVKPFGAEKPIFGDSFSATFGKMANPFITPGMGPSLLIWDGDQMPEGAALQWGGSPCDCWDTNFDVAYYVIDENNGPVFRDPNMIAVELDNFFTINDQLSHRFHVAYFGLRKLDAAFLARGIADGNTAGLTSNNHIDLIEYHGGITWVPHEDWPITFWGNVLVNLSADGVGEGKQDTAFGAGIELGDRKKYLLIGVGYYQIEADSVPGILNDSDVMDGVNNGEDYQVYVRRQLWKNTDFRFEVFFTDPLDDDVSDLQGDTPDDRIRMRADVNIKF